MMNRLLRHLRISGRRTTFLTLGAGLILVVAVTAAIAQSTQVIKACYDPKSGALRIDTTEKPCDSNKEKSLSWNQQGPARPAGPAGPEGPAGSDGSSDADTLDGQDSTAFLPSKIYTVRDTEVKENAGVGTMLAVDLYCDPGDLVLSGGFITSGPAVEIMRSYRFPETTDEEGGVSQAYWHVVAEVEDESPRAFVDANALCADTIPGNPTR